MSESSFGIFPVKELKNKASVTECEPLGRAGPGGAGKSCAVGPVPENAVRGFEQWKCDLCFSRFLWDQKETEWGTGVNTKWG